LAETQVAGKNRSEANIREMARLIARMGPNIDEVSRIIGAHNETMRYRYRRLLERGFTIQASCNYESLGMKRVVAVVEPNDFFRDNAETMFYLLHELAFVTGYAKIRRGGLYVVSASVPEESLSSWADFMLRLKDGVLKSIESVTLDQVRNPPMKVECFDFDTGKWRLNLRARSDPVGADEAPVRRQRYDTTDLKIVSQLQMDANASLAEMCKNVGASNYKTFTWHFREHVLRRHLIKGYRLNWMGMRSGRKSGGLRRYSWIDVIARDLSEAERIDLARVINRTPFIWIEGAGTRTYYCRMVVPVEHGQRLQKLLDGAISPIRDRARWLQMDPRRAVHFSLDVRNYDERSGIWRFNKDEILQSLASMQNIRRQVTGTHPPAGDEGRRPDTH
jgi:DNA-binding Lrp family transcriptional regulator